MPRETSTAGATSPAPKKSFMAATKPPSEAPTAPGRGREATARVTRAWVPMMAMAPLPLRPKAWYTTRGTANRAVSWQKVTPSRAGARPGFCLTHSAPRRYSSICFSSFSRAAASLRTRRTRTSRDSTQPVSFRAALGRNMRHSMPAVSTPFTAAPNRSSSPRPVPRLVTRSKRSRTMARA